MIKNKYSRKSKMLFTIIAQPTILILVEYQKSYFYIILLIKNWSTSYIFKKNSVGDFKDFTIIFIRYLYLSKFIFHNWFIRFLIMILVSLFH